MGLLTPTRYKDGITDITVEELSAMGIRGLFLDVDNTLTEHGSQVLSPSVEKWLSEMQAAGISLTVVSNSTYKRVSPFAQQIGLRFIACACKPLPFGFWRAAKRLSLPLGQCAAIGDQLFTDIFGAKLAGVRSFQLKPIRLEEGKPFLLFKRRLEGWVMAHGIKKQNGKKGEP